MCGHTCVVVLTLLILWRCHFRDSQAPIAHVGVGRALTGAGWGVFALNNIACNSFICLYTVIYIYIYIYIPLSTVFEAFLWLINQFNI